MADRSAFDFDIMTAHEAAKVVGVDERTLRRWVNEGYFPKATFFGKRKGWRPGQIQRWMDATEFLQGLGLTTLVPPEDDESPEK